MATEKRLIARLNPKRAWKKVRLYMTSLDGAINLSNVLSRNNPEIDIPLDMVTISGKDIRFKNEGNQALVRPDRPGGEGDIILTWVNDPKDGTSEPSTQDADPEPFKDGDGNILDFAKSDMDKWTKARLIHLAKLRSIETSVTDETSKTPRELTRPQLVEAILKAQARKAPRDLK